MNMNIYIYIERERERKTHHPSRSLLPQLQKYLDFLLLQLLPLPPLIPYPIQIILELQTHINRLYMYLCIYLFTLV